MMMKTTTTTTTMSMTAATEWTKKKELNEWMIHRALKSIKFLFCSLSTSDIQINFSNKQFLSTTSLTKTRNSIKNGNIHALFTQKRVKR